MEPGGTFRPVQPVEGTEPREAPPQPKAPQYVRHSICSPGGVMLVSLLVSVGCALGAALVSSRSTEPLVPMAGVTGGRMRQSIGALCLIISTVFIVFTLSQRKQSLGGADRRPGSREAAQQWCSRWCGFGVPRGSIYLWLLGEENMTMRRDLIIQLIVMFWMACSIFTAGASLIWLNSSTQPKEGLAQIVDFVLFDRSPNSIALVASAWLLSTIDELALRCEALEGMRRPVPPLTWFLRFVGINVNVEAPAMRFLTHWAALPLLRTLRRGEFALRRAWPTPFETSPFGFILGLLVIVVILLRMVTFRSALMAQVLSRTTAIAFLLGIVGTAAGGVLLPIEDVRAIIEFLEALAGGYGFPLLAWVFVLRTESQRVGLLSKFLRYLSHEVRVPANVGLLALEDVKATLSIIGKRQGIQQHAPGAGRVDDHEDDSAVAKESLPPVLRAQEGASDAEAALQQMKALLDRTLDLARFDAGVQQVDMQPLNLASTLASIHKAVMPAYRAAGVTLHWAVEGGLEDVEGGVHVLGDVLRIRQAIMNVLHNGSKYSARGDSVYFSASVAWSDSKRMSPLQVAPSSPTQAHMPKSAAEDAQPSMEHVGPMWSGIGSSVSSTATGGSANSRCHLLVRVRDTGRGMTDAEQASIFTPFARLHTAQEGTGLGLNIAKKAMVAHGGDVQVWSAGIGEGCTFTITAVLASVPEGMELPVSELSPVLEDEKEVVPRPVTAHILVVDDDTPTRRITGKLLYRSLPNSKVAFAVNGGEAVDMVKAGLAGEGPLPTHITLDDQMPVMTGRQAARAMRELGFTGRIVGVTGNAGLADQESFIAAGVDEVVVKPTTAAKLVAALLLHRQGQGKRMRPHASYAGRADAKARVLRA